MSKTCTKCKELKTLEAFYCQRSKYNAQCKKCKQIKEREWRLNNKERNKVAEERSRDKRKDKIRLAATRWGELNKDRKLQSTKRWQKQNPGKVNAITAKRRAAKLRATPKWLTSQQLTEISEFYILAKELQWLSDPTSPLQVDHIIPLQGKNVSGLHVPWNLQILPKKANLIKGNKVIE